MTVSGSQFIAFQWFAVGLTLFLVGLRTYVRFTRVATRSTMIFTYISESLMAIAWLFGLGIAIVCTELWKRDVIRPSTTTELADGTSPLYETPVMKLLFSLWFMYFTPMYCVKNVMMIFYYTTVIPPSMHKTYLAFKIIWVYLILSFLSYILSTALWCLPWSREWDLSDPRGFCHREGWKYAFTVYFPHFTTDFLVYIIPIPVLLRLQLSRQQQISAAISFVFGLLCIIFATLQVISMNTPGKHSMANNFLFATFEYTWAIIVPCVPAFKVFLRIKPLAIKEMPVKGATDEKPSVTETEPKVDRPGNMVSSGTMTMDADSDVEKLSALATVFSNSSRPESSKASLEGK